MQTIGPASEGVTLNRASRGWESSISSISLAGRLRQTLPVSDSMTRGTKIEGEAGDREPSNGDGPINYRMATDKNHDQQKWRGQSALSI